MRWLAGAMTVACAVLVGPSVAGDALLGGSLPPDAVREVVPHRVMTWNLCNPCEQSNADRAAEIAAYAPQVIALQEACARDVARIRYELERRYGLVYHVAYGTVLQDWGRCGGVPWSPDGYGQALLSAAPMTDRVTAEYPDGGSEDRGYMAVTTSVGGRLVRVFNTHLAERRQESVRAGQVGVLAAKVARYDRAIVLGDFNAVPDAPELAPMWALAADTDPRCHPSPADGCRTTTDWHSKFDYVFLRGVTALEHHVHPSSFSDHHLLDTDLDVTQGVTATAAPATK
ncbi:endonuclease/exonuclease/phosphatase family protein [Streptomyces sp. NBC_00199]|uniref:endonuclease/exonuclease/phosphatase family protein n=1 Tax=Streptomyces sp. NBC_00199 TaxID=2975678 RepID=UPI002251BBFF|nr:endonuclease/exonuclease/phosphatase family protein [Streptomyces sp. NBC_00199]MCX5264658.1 endonuclease/exonuclease/phosphatase family protein [Streptomyces sp. NBC_00199]